MGSSWSVYELDLAGGHNPGSGVGAIGFHLALQRGVGGSPSPIWGEEDLMWPQSRLGEKRRYVMTLIQPHRGKGALSIPIGGGEGGPMQSQFGLMGERGLDLTWPHRGEGGLT